MNCYIGFDKIHAYLKGRLNPQETADFEQHLKGCGNCRREVAQEKKLDSFLAAWEISDPRPGFNIRLKARLAEGKKTSSKWFGLSLPAFSTLAAILIVSGLALWLEWPKISMPMHSINRPEIVLAEHLEFIKKIEMLQQWEMLKNWDEISATRPGKGKI